MHQIIFFRKFRIRALCKMVSGGMVLFIVWLRYAAETRRMLCVLFSISCPHFLKNLVDQPHIKTSIQINDLSQFYKSCHKQLCDKLLQFFYWRMVRKQRIHGENNDTAIDCERMTGLFSTVVRKLFQIFVILATGRLPNFSAFRFSIPRFQPFFYFRTEFWHITQFHMFCHKFSSAFFHKCKFCPNGTLILIYQANYNTLA